MIISTATAQTKITAEWDYYVIKKIVALALMIAVTMKTVSNHIIAFWSGSLGQASN